MLHEISNLPLALLGNDTARARDALTILSTKLLSGKSKNNQIPGQILSDIKDCADEPIANDKYTGSIQYVHITFHVVVIGIQLTVKCHGEKKYTVQVLLKLEGTRYKSAECPVHIPTSLS